MKEMFMKEAIKQAKKALEMDEVPIGCVVVFKDKIIARAYNKREKNKSSIAHAEIIAINKACKKIGDWRLNECDIYITLEPCMMCTGAISLSRFNSVYFGAKQHKIDSYFNAIGLNHYPRVMGGVLENECKDLLVNFFNNKRGEKRGK